MNLQLPSTTGRVSPSSPGHTCGGVCPPRACRKPAEETGQAMRRLRPSSVPQSEAPTYQDVPVLVPSQAGVEDRRARAVAPLPAEGGRHRVRQVPDATGRIPAQRGAAGLNVGGEQHVRGVCGIRNVARNPPEPITTLGRHTHLQRVPLGTDTFGSEARPGGCNTPAGRRGVSRADSSRTGVSRTHLYTETRQQVGEVQPDRGRLGRVHLNGNRCVRVKDTHR